MITGQSEKFQPYRKTEKNMTHFFRIIIIDLFLVVFDTGCDPMIVVNGHVFSEATQNTTFAGGTIPDKKTVLSDAHVTLQPPENPNIASSPKTITDSKGYYHITAIEHRGWWKWRREWEVVFEKEGYEPKIINLDQKKDKDPESELRYQFRINVVLTPIKQ